MLSPEQIRAWIVADLECAHLDVEGDGHHFQALIVSPAFIGKNRVQRQQQVNAVLRPHFDSGDLHALSMQTLTPDEWSAQRG